MPKKEYKNYLNSQFTPLCTGMFIRNVVYAGLCLLCIRVIATVDTTQWYIFTKRTNKSSGSKA